jgi:hypothetical protein
MQATASVIIQEADGRRPEREFDDTFSEKLIFRGSPATDYLKMLL